MRRILGKILAWIGGLVVLVGCGVVALSVYWMRHQPKLPERVVLTLDVDAEKEFRESTPDAPWAQLLSKQKAGLHALIEALDHAATDPHVAGLVTRVGNGSLGLAQTQELREAIGRFRNAGKFAYVYADTFGEATSGNGAYYLATAFEQIWLQSSGDVNLTGLAIETPFVRGTLDKLEIVPQLGQRKEYKNAPNSLTETKFTAAHKEATQALLQSVYGQWTRGVAQGRGVSEDNIRRLVEEGPYGAQDAHKAHLIDTVGTRDQCEQEATKRAGARAGLVPWNQYAQQGVIPPTVGPQIALIYGVGPVMRGSSDFNPLSGESTFGAESVANAFREAIQDDDIKAIVFRIDSPGGSYVASDTVWQQVMRAKQAKKPVIVSMGNMAGSGGYFVAMAADKIVADPGTLTGSIGVFGGKMVPTKLLNRLGVTFEEVHIGKHALLWSPLHTYSTDDWAKVNQSLDRIYDDFTTKAAAGRHMPKEKMLELAKGRVWTGEEAKKRGLVDELGGLHTAIQLARTSLGVKEHDPVRMQVLPRPKGPLQLLQERLSGQVSVSMLSAADREALAHTLREVQPMIRTVKQLSGVQPQQVLEMPVMHLNW